MFFLFQQQQLFQRQQKNSKFPNFQKFFMGWWHLKLFLDWFEVSLSIIMYQIEKKLRKSKRLTEKKIITKNNNIDKYKKNDNLIVIIIEVL